MQHINSKPNQCTINPQIVQEADKIYGVSHAHRISQIDVITREDALGFLQVGGGLAGWVWA